MRNISNIKGVLYAVVSSATFGLIPLFSIPLLHAGMASPTILFYRMLLSAAIMAAVALLLKRNFRISRRDFGVLAGLSLMYAATSLGLLRSYDYIPSGVATTVNFLYPLVVTIVMTLFSANAVRCGSSSRSSFRSSAWRCWRGATRETTIRDAA